MGAGAGQAGAGEFHSGRLVPRFVSRFAPRLVVVAALLGVCAGVIVLWRLRSARAMDDDELQHMHFAWCLTQGLVPYRDFWDNHPPLLHHFLGLLIRRAGESSAAFILARAWMFALAVPAVGATFLLGRMCFNTGAGLLAAAWLACSEVFLLKAIEIRPDGLMTALSTMGLALLAAGLRAKGREDAAAPCCEAGSRDGAVGSRDVAGSRDAVSSPGWKSAGPASHPPTASGFPPNDRLESRPPKQKSFSPRTVTRSLDAVAGVAARPLSNGAHVSRTWRKPGILRGTAPFLAAGLCFGLACVLGTKSAVVFVLAAGALAGSVVSQPGRSKRDVAVALSLAAAGFLIPPGIWLVWAAFDRSAGPALRLTLWENLSYPQRFSPWSLIASTQPYALLTAAGLGACSIFQRTLPSATRSARAFVASCAALTTLAYATMPAAYLQSALIALPSLCVLAGAGTLWVIQGFGTDRPEAARWRGAISMAGCAAFLALAVLRPLWRVEQAVAQQAPQWLAALEVVDELQQRTGPHDVVFDGRCEAVFRPHAYFYPALVQGVLTRYREGAVQPRVAEALARRPASVILRDSRNAKLPEEDWGTITAQYVAMPPPWEWILLPGWTIEPPDAGAVEVVTGVAAPMEGVYTVQRRDARTRVFVNDSEVGQQARLNRGVHTVRLVAPMAPVTIRRFPGQTLTETDPEDEALQRSP